MRVDGEAKIVLRGSNDEPIKITSARIYVESDNKAFVDSIQEPLKKIYRNVASEIVEEDQEFLVEGEDGFEEMGGEEL